MLRYDELASPRGLLRLALDEVGLAQVNFIESDAALPPAGWVQDPAALAPFVAQFAAYFAGELHTFDLPLSLHGTDFQCQVWRALAQIPYGQTRSYGQQAADLGRPTAVRAVGAANGRNPLPIVLPCHRVIGANGQLTGYAGGLERKRWLLAHEARVLQAQG
ncbi:methylated-DNA--[protein]-cysteine S-methyltransferase [Pseudaeromonas paramecii]|uniref:Methylated-DNA--protein-cysteine methyltransferase n=1 Tax=Pseudaeromonas paramecii TaxID=2138166 RepID=A0ABP8Q259_9GAMM